MNEIQSRALGEANDQLGECRRQLESADLLRSRPDLGAELEALRASIVALATTIEIVVDLSC